MERPIRVWLEPAYDRGRVGCWMLDWPGSFTWADDGERALAQVPSAVGRFVDWRDGHGEVLELPDTGHTEIVEEVPARLLDGDYEVNATFQADERTVEPAEVEQTIRRIDDARADLLEVTRRLDAHEAAHGPLPAGPGPRVERTSDAVLRHLAGAEIWLAGRADRDNRYAGPERDGLLAPFLEASHAWAVDELRSRAASQSTTPVADGKSETWTVAKICRRLVYHALDHLWELERRLALVDGTLERVELRRNGPLDLDELVRLLRLAGIPGRTDDRRRLQQMLAGTTETVRARHEGQLIGFCRTISDGAFNAYVSTVAVHPRWQGLGVGGRMMEALIDGRDDIKFVLDARPGTEGFYRGLGFERSPKLMNRRRIH